MSKWCLCVWALPVFIPWLNIFFAAQLGELLKVASGGAWEPNWAHQRLLAMEEFFRVMNKPLAWVLFLAVSFFNYLWSQIKTVVMAGLLLWYRNLHVLVKGIYFPRISLRLFFSPLGTFQQKHIHFQQILSSIFTRFLSLRARHSHQPRERG